MPRTPRASRKAKPARGAEGRAAFLFDMDGVVVDNMRFHETAWRRFFESHGLAMDSEEFFRKTSGMPTKDVLSYFFKREVGAEEAARLTDAKEALYREIYGPHLRAAEGLAGFLAASKAAGVAVGVGTGSLPENVGFVLDGLGIRTLFSAVVGPLDVRKGKPAPDTFLTLAGRLGAEPARCVVFEDSILGEEAARAAGMKVVAVTTSHAEAEFAGPDLAVPHFSGLSVERVLALINGNG